jgi:putative DNA primase/helicase
LAAAFDESARCPLFAQVLSEALPDEADRHVYQVFCGYILNPTCEHEVSFVNFGPGGTGKSTLAGGIAELLGPDLCSAAGLEELCKSGSYTLPSLKSKMLNLGSELNGTEIEESANFKKLVSGEPLNVRRIYGAPEDMRTTCKLWFLTNNMPRFRGGTDAETRRLRILHFAVQPKKKDSTLKEKLRGELSGILNWMVEGALWLLEKKRIPNGGATTAKVMESFHRGNDPVGAFVRDRCVFDAHEVMVKGSLLDAFREWCDAAGLPSEKLENYFFKTLLNRHPGLRNSRRMIKSKREHCLVGIGLKPGEDAEPSGMNEEQMFAFKEKLRAKLGIVEEQ